MSAPLSLDDLREIDRRCERFEDALRAGAAPDAADFIAGIEGPALERLWDELGAIKRECDTRPRAPAADGIDEALAAAARAAGFELLGRLGSGGMGVVYRARQLSLGRAVALKMLHPAGDPALAARLVAEARVTARLAHPNIVRIHEVGELLGRPFLVLELAEGGSLATRLRDGPLPPPDAAALVLTLAQAVHHAHSAGVVHRDIKPANVLMDGPVPRLTDFGLARQVDLGTGPTAAGAVLGTPAYMAPEQARPGESVGPAADVYGLGALLYECLTGRPPFRGPDAVGTLWQVVHDDPVPPRRLQPGVPRDLDTVALKCLEKSPARRYHSAADLADDLRRFLDGRPVLARPASALLTAWKWAARQPAAAALLLTLLLAATAGLPLVTGLWLTAESERREKEREADDARRARDRLARAVYAGQIGLAYRDYLDNDVISASRRLDECREDLRRWEWHYLRGLCAAGGGPTMRHPRPDETPSIGRVAWKAVHSLAVLPGTGRLASAAGLPQGMLSGQPDPSPHTPGEVAVWEGGRRVATLTPHKGAAWAVAVSPDGRLLATGGADGSVGIHDAASLAPLPGPRRNTGAVTGLAFDGRRLAIASALRISVWDAERGEESWGVNGRWRHPQVAFLAGRLYAVSEGAGRLQAWDAAGKPVDLPDAPAGCRALATRARPPLLAVARGRAVELYDPAGPRPLRRLDGHTGDVLALAFDAGGRLASAGEDRSVRLWDAPSGQHLFTLRGHAGGVTALAFAPGGRLFSGSKDQDVRSWDASRDPLGLALRATTPPHLGEWLTTFHFDADGDEIVGVESTLHLRRLDARTGALRGHKVLRPGITQYLRPLVAASNGRLVAANDPAHPGKLRLYDPRTGADAGIVDGGHANASFPAISPDGRRVAFRASDEGRKDGGSSLVLADVGGGPPVRVPFAEGEGPLPLAFSPDGRLVAGAVMAYERKGANWAPTTTAAVALWDAATGAERRRLAVGAGDIILRVAFSPDGKTLAAASFTGAARVWDLAGGDLRFPVLAAAPGLAAAAFSPDGERLALYGMNGLAQVHDARDGTQLLTLPRLVDGGTGHYGFLPRVAFCPKGRRLAVNNWDGNISVYDAHNEATP